MTTKSIVLQLESKMSSETIEAPPRCGHEKCLLFMLPRELRDTIYEYTLSGFVSIQVDLTDMMTFLPTERIRDVADTVAGLTRTCSVIRQECSRIVKAQPQLQIRLPSLWDSPGREDFKLNSASITSLLHTRPRTSQEPMLMPKGATKQATDRSIFGRGWAVVDFDLGMMDTTSYMKLYDGFWQASQIGLMRMIRRLLYEVTDVRLIAQARLRNGQVVHLVLGKASDLPSAVPWPVAADGSPVGPTNQTILSAARLLNMDRSVFGYSVLGKDKIECVYIDPRY